ncbi:hypothetical protein K474DRAFT_1563293, partial [Panus rudis PR-1116 ss-1]
MNTINASTGFTPFQLHIGRSPRVIPPLSASDVEAVAAETTPEAAISAADLIRSIDTDVMEAQDNLLLAKSDQAHHANKHRSQEHVYSVGDSVLISTFHRRREYMQKGDNRVAK